MDMANTVKKFQLIKKYGKELKEAGIDPRPLSADQLEAEIERRNKSTMEPDRKSA